MSNSQNYNRYTYVLNNPLKYVDPTGEFTEPWENDDDYWLDENGQISLLRKTDDNFDRLWAVNQTSGDIEEMTIQKGSAADKTILADLANYTLPRDVSVDDYQAIFRRGTTGDQQTAEQLFRFAADYSNVEWSMAQDKSNQFHIGTFQFKELSPGFPRYGLDVSTVSSFIHSHPNIALNREVSSMGDWGDGLTRGDWAQEVRRSKNNGGVSPFSNQVYFPNTKNVYDVKPSGIYRTKTREFKMFSK